jgi:Fe2+ or Zn2+ uptake regulation protein
MNTYRCSSGERISKGKIDRNIRHAKEQKIREFKNDNGFFYCEQCGTNQGRIDCSHIISVKYAQETGRAQLAYQVKNIKLHCAGCHADIERKTNFERENIYVQING